jgi:hypothetical protein
MGIDSIVSEGAAKPKAAKMHAKAGIQEDNLGFFCRVRMPKKSRPIRPQKSVYFLSEIQLPLAPIRVLSTSLCFIALPF